MNWQDVRDHLNLRLETMLGHLERLVEFESPSRAKESLDGLVMAMSLRFLEFPEASAELIDNDRGGKHLLARFPGPAELRPALVLGHYDTVWPKGTIERMPFRHEGDRAFGPGIFDMKAGF